MVSAPSSFHERRWQIEVWKNQRGVDAIFKAGTRREMVKPQCFVFPAFFISFYIKNKKMIYKFSDL
ncbi:MAG: hypothetical protein COX90_03290 [Candidatus Nealsonbacteria bacterium CG_4_10_14_0_2_um_filter_38_17]|uniref:Uncharacterized protein n=1 Tax=Candidatus Nealsonbacteria bacterium CG_4_10_14_0_2_um_filter_38_17 TaxID=1974680 RepID=A0A2M7UXQ8_9BACT|nr:MAG: hypothetical protein COX90_03290 [Candidatus Nealsonbacteria bacterium CG_4_10_14_0_2_um_filter_38_17]